MSSSHKISISIVIYNEDIELFKPRLASILQSRSDCQIYIIDNSPNPTPELETYHKDVTYIYNHKNLGFGSAHNLVLERLHSEYHLILNPDVDFDPDILSILIQQLKQHPTAGFITPKVFNPDGSLQFLCRRHPSLLTLLNRRLRFSKKLSDKDEYRRPFRLDATFEPEFIHGCFMFFKTKVIKDVAGFDERYFLYMEDADLCRKIAASGFVPLYFPEVSIVHQHRRGSTHSLKLFLYHLQSIFLYFLKWGFR